MNAARVFACLALRPLPTLGRHDAQRRHLHGDRLGPLRALALPVALAARPTEDDFPGIDATAQHRLDRQLAPHRQPHALFLRVQAQLPRRGDVLGVQDVGDALTAAALGAECEDAADHSGPGLIDAVLGVTVLRRARFAEADYIALEVRRAS
jgi:hypothetical protein